MKSIIPNTASGELIDEGAYESYGEQAVFFRKYFDCVINGRYEEYPELFTDGFFKRYTIPERFTMQKIYDIRVDLTDKKRGRGGWEADHLVLLHGFV